MEPNVLVKINALDNTKAAFASLKTSLGKVEDTVSNAKQRIQDLEPAFQRMAVGGTAAFAAITTFSVKMIREAGEAEVAQKRLAHVIQTSTGASDAQVAALIRQAEAMERVGVVSADAINIMQEEAASFDLSADAIEKLTPAAADFAVALYGINPSAEQARQAMTGLGKAMQGQLELLSKKGYVIDEDTKALFKNGSETERVAKMIEILGTNYQDLNTSMRQTTEGGITGASFALGQLGETIGVALVPAFTKVIEAITPVIEKFSEWAEANPELLSKIILVSAGIAGVVAVLGALGIAILAFNPIAVILVGAIVGIGLIIHSVSNALSQFGLTWSNIWEGIKTVAVTYVDLTLEAIERIITAVKRALDALSQLPGVKTAISITKSAFSKIGSFFTPEARAKGGPVMAGSPYIVGEVGPELFVPSSSGTIVPNNALQPAMAAGGSPVYITISGNSFMGERDMAEKVGDQLIRIIKQNVRL